MDAESIKNFREKFTSQYMETIKKENFDSRDVTRLLDDDAYASAFLMWKKNNISDSAKLAADVFEWRKKNNVTDLSACDIDEEFYSKKSFFIRGKDRDGNRIIYFIGKRFSKGDEAEAKKLLMYLMERLQRNDPGSRVMFILDAGGCGMSNVDLGVIKLIVDSFMYYFPSLLGRTFVVDLPGVLTAIWNVVKVWFDEEIKNRTHHCSRKDLEKYVALEQLQTVLGGTDEWEPSTNVGSDIEAEFTKEEIETFTDAVENLEIKE
ncbi:motile sperm domain-containing protein 2-like isoform X1 [Styela clava]